MTMPTEKQWIDTTLELARLREENERLRRLNESLAARVAAQSELLTRKAEKQ